MVVHRLRPFAASLSVCVFFRGLCWPIAQVPTPVVALDPMEGAIGTSAGGQKRKKKRKSSYYSEEVSY